MISRRQMIGYAVAASATGWANAVESGAKPAAPIALLVVDERFDAARALASLAEGGAPRVALPRDVLELWHRQIEPLCGSGRHAIAGVTTERGFFLLRTLAADHRLRVLSRTVHADGLVSWVLGPKA